MLEVFKIIHMDKQRRQPHPLCVHFKFFGKFKVLRIFCAFVLVYINDWRGVRDLNICIIWDETFLKHCCLKKIFALQLGIFFLVFLYLQIIYMRHNSVKMRSNF